MSNDRGSFPPNPDQSGGVMVEQVEAPGSLNNGGPENYARNPDAVKAASLQAESQILQDKAELRRIENSRQFTIALIFLGAIAFILVATFTYAAIVKDTELPGEVIKDIFVFLGGGGIGTLFLSSRREGSSE